MVVKPVLAFPSYKLLFIHVLSTLNKYEFNDNINIIIISNNNNNNNNNNNKNTRSRANQPQISYHFFLLEFSQQVKQDLVDSIRLY